MKANICTKGPGLLDLKFRPLFTNLVFAAISLVPSIKTTAQQHTPHSVRDTRSNDNTGNATSRGTTTTVKTLSVVPGVTPRENIINTNNRGNTARGKAGQGNYAAIGGNNSGVSNGVSANTGNPGNLSSNNAGTTTNTGNTTNNAGTIININGT